MILEYYHFIKNYFKLSQTNYFYFACMNITAILYKACSLLNTFLAALIIQYVTENNAKMSFLCVLFLALSHTTYHIFHYLNVKVYGKNMNYSYTHMQSKLYHKVVNADDSFTKKISKGKLLNSINSDVINIGDLCDVISEFFTTILEIIAVFMIVLFYNPGLSIFYMAYAIFYVHFRNTADRKGNVYYKGQKKKIDQYSSLFSQILSGLQEIKTFHMLPKLEENLGEIEKEYSTNYLTKRKYFTRRDIDIRFISYGTRVLVYFLLLLEMLYHGTNISVLLLLVGYHEKIIVYLENFITQSTTIREVSVGVDRIASILNYESEVTNFGRNYNDAIQGKIVFENVYFSYNKSKEILKGVSFTIEPKSITAIVGQSGMGKTSIINLLLRLYSPQDGKIYIDGVDIFDYSREVYKSNVSVMSQKPFLFNMSIRKNLDFVDPNVENQIEACKRVGIHDFIMSLPKGYHTILRENANNISGGQKQLISLARTLLSKSEILLLDEITSSLDPETAKVIDRVLKDLKKDHTILMITHKPETMKKADRILVLHNGKIVGDGTHKELLLSCEPYQFLQARKSASRVGVFDNDKIH